MLEEYEVQGDSGPAFLISTIIGHASQSDRAWVWADQAPLTQLSEEMSAARTG